MNDRELRKVAEGREAEIFEWEDGKVLRLMRDPKAVEPGEMFAAATHAAHSAGVSGPVPARVGRVECRRGTGRGGRECLGEPRVADSMARCRAGVGGARVVGVRRWRRCCKPPNPV